MVDRAREGAQRIADHGRLLVDLLVHEVAVVALADQRAGQRGLLDLALDRLALGVIDRGAARVQHRPVAFLQVLDAVGQRRERQGVGAEVHLAVAVADRERAAAARPDQQVVVAGEQDGQRERAVQPLERRRGGRHRPDALSQIVADQLRDHLGVGLGLEAVALGDQLVAQHLEVLDDAVVHHRDAARLVGVGVVAGRRAVGRPAGVADADHAGQRLLLEHPLEVDELALGAAALDAAVDQRGDAGAVVAPVLQTLERIEEEDGGRLAAEDANDATHRFQPPNRASS